VIPPDFAKQGEAVTEEWFKPRGYRHLDRPVGKGFISQVTDSAAVIQHCFLPLLHYEKHTRRYRPQKHLTEIKSRPIMYSSHHDACILSYYAHTLNKRLELLYSYENLSDAAIAYRKLGKSNYDFAADVVKFVNGALPCAILCFDVSDFFGHLDHGLLKRRLKALLGVDELTRDWYAVFRSITQYAFVDLETLRQHPKFSERFNKKLRIPFASIQEIKAEGVEVQKNPNKFGIPQGTPISAVLSNLYMIDLDRALNSWCASQGGLYRRYSDDILVVCPTKLMSGAESYVKECLETEKLQVNDDKTDRCIYDGNQSTNPQYLGFELSPDGLLIRASSLARQWRKLRRNIRRIKLVGQTSIANGSANKIFTRKLRRKFTALRVRNFSSYARRSADTLASPRILRQTRRLERVAEREIAALKKYSAPDSEN
jgi:hypothetical protein